MSVAFEWDLVKAKSKFRKHGVAFDEAVTVFGDVLSMTINDPLHSEDEDRRSVARGRQNLSGFGFRE